MHLTGDRTAEPFSVVGTGRTAYRDLLFEDVEFLFDPFLIEVEGLALSDEEIKVRKKQVTRMKTLKRMLVNALKKRYKKRH